MTVSSAYLAISPLVREWYEEADRRMDAYLAEVRALKPEFPGYIFYEWESHRGRRLLGVSASRCPNPAQTRTDCPGPLWRRDGDAWVPSRRTLEGRALYERLSAVRCNYGDVPGVSNLVRTPGFAHFPCVRPIGGELWLTFTCPPEAVAAAGDFDSTIWRPMRLSEFYAALEAQEATPALFAEATP